MSDYQKYHLYKIREDLSLKKRENPLYSLRAYARDMGIHPATLSQVLKEKRPLPLKNAVLIAKKLCLDPKEKTLFMDGLFQGKNLLSNLSLDKTDERFMLDESYYKIIAQWEHYALLELLKLKDISRSIEEMSKKLGITSIRMNIVIQNLLCAGLIQKMEDGSFVCLRQAIRTTEDIQSQALQKSHKETLEMGKIKLETIEIELRDFSSMTIGVDLKKLSEVKAIIREFRQKLTVLLRDGDKTEIFQLAIQFYPLTVVEENINEKNILTKETL